MKDVWADGDYLTWKRRWIRGGIGLVFAYFLLALMLWYGPVREDPWHECHFTAPNRGPVLETVEADWRWVPPGWWCNYRWADGVVSDQYLLFR